MFVRKTTILAVLLCIYKIGAQSDGNHGSECAPQSASYNLTCRPSGTFASLTWRRGSTDIMLCASATGQCFPNFSGYNGYKISDSEYVLEIVSLSSSTDSGNWTCSAGSIVIPYSLVVREVLPTGTLKGMCVNEGNQYNISCSGLLTPGTPQVDLQIKNGISTIVSTNTELSLSTVERNALQNYSCSAQCLPTVSFTCEATPPPDPCDSDCAWYAVIILVVLLVVKIVTDGMFVAYRWGDKCKQSIEKQRNILYWICFVQGIINSICGVVFIIIICLAYPECLEEALAIAALVISIIVLITGLIYIVMFLCIIFSCKQMTDTDRQRNILYWICFVQGIINSICGVVFFILICLAYPECLGECLPIAALVLCIIVLITGLINIVMCLCCCCCPQSSDRGTSGMCAKPDDPSPWLCCCRGTVHPVGERTPAPCSHPPIRPSMASPRKPPVPPSSTTPRALSSPTSDPASDSAVNPSVYLEPLSVEEPKKKKKKRKKRKTTTEAGRESSDQPMNPAGDSDE